MRVVRRNVFETNSSSCHSITLDRYNYDEDSISALLPFNKDKELKYFDILSYPIVKEGYVYDEISKLRIMIALITDMAYDSYGEVVEQEWVKKNGLDKFKWSYPFNDFYLKKTRGKMAKNYIYDYKYFKYLNSILKQRLNINFSMYDSIDYFPYISESVDTNLGCETSHYYRDLGFTLNIDKETFKKKVTEIIFNPKVGIFQETWGND